jgi:hypothetical protein
MMKGRHIIFAILPALCLWPSAASAISISMTSRDDNSWGIQSQDSDQVGLTDCAEGVDFVFTVALESASTSGRKLYLYEGTSCDDTPEDCRIVGDSQAASETVFTVPANELFNGGCEATDTTADLWIGLLESENQAVETDGTGGIWSTAAITINLDITPPATVPTGLSVRVGSGNVRVSWNKVTADDVAGFLLVYWDGAASSTDADTDTDTDADTDTDTTPDAGALLDAGVDAGSGKGVARRKPRGAIVPYADADAGVSEECTITGGFSAGDEFDPSLISHFDDSQESDSEATSATIDGLDNGTQYKFAVVSLDDAANPSAFSEVVCATPERTIDFSDLYGGAGGKGGGEYCFIATAAFGSYDHPVVRALREFRDEFLVKLPGGPTAVAAYYAIGPTLASAIEGHETARAAVREGLFVFSGTAAVLTAIGPARFGFGLAACLLAGLVIGLALPRRRRGA